LALDFISKYLALFNKATFCISFCARLAKLIENKKMNNKKCFIREDRIAKVLTALKLQ
jgi:hypothetical protein